MSMSWKALINKIESIFDEAIDGLDSNDKIHRLIIKDLKSKVTQEIDKGCSELVAETLLDVFQSDVSSDA